jgi:hypothetical protein
MDTPHPLRTDALLLLLQLTFVPIAIRLLIRLRTFGSDLASYPSSIGSGDGFESDKPYCGGIVREIFRPQAIGAPPPPIPIPIGGPAINPSVTIEEDGIPAGTEEGPAPADPPLPIPDIARIPSPKGCVRDTSSAIIIKV